MRCQSCYGRDGIARLIDPVDYEIVTCMDCGGTGIAHCCEGEQAQPNQETWLRGRKHLPGKQA